MTCEEDSVEESGSTNCGAIPFSITDLYEVFSFSYSILRYTLKNQRLKITQLEKAHFIKVNELK